MKRFLLACVVLVGLLLAGLFYERLLVEPTFGPAAMLSLAVVTGFFFAVLATYLLYETRHRAIVGNLWLAVCSLLFTYILLDLAAGYFLIQPLSPPLVPDAHRHHKLVPNSYSRLQQRDFNYIQRVNNLGLRGKDAQAQKPSGTYRVLMLGDSFTMGKGVEDDQTFSVLVERSLNEKLGTCGGRTIEVLNGGVDSYAPILSYIQLTRDLHRLQPDMVILNLDVSDLVQEAAYRREAVRGENGEIVAVPQGERTISLTEEVRRWAERHLFLTRALMFYVNRAMGYRSVTVRDVVTQANVEIAAHTLAGDTQPRDAQWRDIFESVTRMKAFADRKGIEFLLSIYPWGHQVNDTEWIPGRYSYMSENDRASDRSPNTVREFASRSGIPLVDNFPAFRSYRGEDLLYFRHDPHWTPAGHRVMASGVAGQLEARYLSSWCGQQPRQTLTAAVPASSR